MTPHTIDLPWRLSSTSLDDPANIRLWERGGRLVALAMWQQPWACLDLIVAREMDHDRLVNAILAWAGERFRQLDRERGFPLPYWIDVHEDDHERLRLLELSGFTRDERSAEMILSQRLDRPGPVPALPPGFTIRNLERTDAESYGAAHRAAFDSESMTAAWRTRTLEWPLYTSSLDRIVMALDGTVAGFCVGWLAGDGQIGQIEPMGVVPAHRRHGLASILLADILVQFHRCGVREVRVQTELDRTPAVAAYRRAGFSPMGRMLKRGREMVPGDDK